MSSDAIRNQILAAAGPVFAERGFRGATVRDICAAAGVNLAAVNYYFGDKKQLYIETVRHAHQLRSEQVPMPQWSADAAPREKLHGFVVTLLRRMLGEKKTPWASRIMLREIQQPTAACRTLVEDYFRPQFDLLLSILAEIVPSELDLPRRHQLAFSIIGQCFFYRAASEVVPMLISKKEIKAHFSVDQLAEHICQLTYAGLVNLPDFALPDDLSPIISRQK